MLTSNRLSRKMVVANISSLLLFDALCMGFIVCTQDCSIMNLEEKRIYGIPNVLVILTSNRS